ncbi:MAG: DUF3887 domain-containing protein [Tenuifilaceae bacterium]|jgi:hypothetical protein|nr:DUF3887 domain-containing protein [Tenuifilaceae bacterium]
MRSTIFLLSFSLLFSLGSCGQDFSKLNKSDENAAKIKIAEDFSSSYFTRLKGGSYYQFGDEAIEKFKNFFTESNQKVAYQQIKQQFGDYESVTYAETWKQKGFDNVHIIRLKGKFSKSTKLLEVRVVIDEDSKIAGFWVKPWSDMLM